MLMQTNQAVQTKTNSNAENFQESRCHSVTSFSAETKLDQGRDTVTARFGKVLKITAAVW